MRASRPPHVRLLEGLVSIQNGKWNTTTLTGAVCAGTVISEPPLRSAVPEAGFSLGGIWTDFGPKSAAFGGFT